MAAKKELAYRHPNQSPWYNARVTVLNHRSRLSKTEVSPGRPAAVEEVLHALRVAQADHRLVPAPGTTPYSIVVAASGGADSVCLLHALHTLAPAWNLALHVAHLDHALRPESAGDARFVEELTQQLGLPFHSDRLDPGSLADQPGGVEAAARSARYDFLARVARALGNAPIAVAHHLDDQAETVLLRLIQGSGLAGLSGMAWVSPLPGAPELRLLRPLLRVPRAVLRAYLMAEGLTWCEDATNLDTHRARNAIRQDILPSLARLNPNIAATLAATADRLAAEAARARQADTAAFDDLLLEEGTHERLVFDLDRLRRAGLATQRGVLRLALTRLALDGRDAGHAAIERILSHVAGPVTSGGPYPLLDGVVWTVVGAASNRPARLSLHREHVMPLTPTEPSVDAARPSPIPAIGSLPLAGGWALHSDICARTALPADWNRRGTPWRAFLDAGVAAELSLTVPQSGMRVTPLGMHGHTRSLGDIFTDHKVPLVRRSTWPVVVDHLGQVVWVCGLIVSEHAALRPDTQQVRRLTWQKMRVDVP